MGSGVNIVSYHGSLRKMTKESFMPNWEEQTQASPAFHHNPQQADLVLMYDHEVAQPAI